MKILSDHETVMELLSLMKENGRELQAEELSCLIAALDSLEQQYSSALAELKDIKRDLTPEQPSFNLIQAAQEKVEQARDQLAAVKEKIISWAKTAVEDFKRVGVSALDAAISFLGVKKLLEAMQDKVCGAMENVDASAKKVEAMGQELRSAGAHLKNAGRAATGKEAQAVDGKQPGRLQSAALAPMQAAHGVLAGLNRTIYAAEGAVERLGHCAEQGRGKREKTSVRRRLTQKKMAIPAPPAPGTVRNPRGAER